jgi:hypothetical protein
MVLRTLEIFKVLIEVNLQPVLDNLTTKQSVTLAKFGPDSPKT